MSNDSFKVKNSINIAPKSTAVTQAGDIRIASDDSNRMKVHDGTSERTVQSVATPLTVSRAVATDINGDLSSSTTTDTELGYVAGVTSAIQTQIDGKQATGNYITALTGDVAASGPGSSAATIQAGAVTNSKVSNTAAIAYSKLNLTGNILNADINASAAIAYSKLTLTGSIVNADISSSAAIARSKVASGTTNHVVINDGSTGALSSEAQLAKSRGGTGADNSSVTFPSTGVLVTEGGIESLTNKTFDSTSTLTGAKMASFTPDGTHTLTAPAATDTIAVLAASQILTNKTISGASNTLSNIATSTLTGTLQAAQFPTLTGDVTTAGGALATTLATVNSNTGSFGSSSAVPVITVNGKGLITAVSTSAVTASPAWNYVSKTSTYSAVANDFIKASSASFTITLPTAVGVTGQSITIQHAGTSLTQVYTLNTTSSQTIDGIASGSYALYTNGEVLVLTSDGANWMIQCHKATTAWTAYTPTFTGLGSPTNISYYWSRNGPSMKVHGTHVNGTTAASLFSMTIPSSASIDTTPISINNTISNPGSWIGTWVDSGSTVSFTNMVSATGTSATLVYFGGFSNGAAKLTPANGNNSGTGATASINFEIPISGWRP